MKTFSELTSLKGILPCGHPRYCLYHRDFGNYVLEFCVGDSNYPRHYTRKLKGKKCKLWQEILRRVSGGD